MARHFGAQHIVNGYAAMGNAKARHRHKVTSGRDIKAAIEAERRRAARMAKGAKPGKG